MYTVWKLLHFFGWAAWFIGLVGSTSTAAAMRRMGTPDTRRAAWDAGRRLWTNEIVGMVLTPISGLALGATLAGGFGAMFTTPSLRFVHWKLLLVLVALVANVILFRVRRRVTAAIDAGGPELDASYKRLAMVQGIATMMLPLAIVVVVVMKYGG